MLLKTIILGLIQGLTEFLPISSSGHLVIFGQLLGEAVNNITLDIFLHFGTLLAIILFYRTDLIRLLRALIHLPVYLKNRKALEPPVAEDLNLIFYICIGTIPAVIVGLLLNDWIESVFQNPKTTSGFLVITGLILWLNRLAKNRQIPMTFAFAVIIGVAQAIAILPGISRSGITITAALLLGMRQEDAAQFSFFLAIPAIAGAVVLTIIKHGISIITALNWVPILIGVSVALISGYAAILVLIKILRREKFYYFSYYCLTFGLISLIYFW